MSAGFFCFPETLFFLVRFKSSGIFLEFNVIADEWFIKKQYTNFREALDKLF